MQPQWGKLLGDIHDLTIDEKAQKEYWTHRGRAVQQAIGRLQELPTNSPL